MKVLVVGYGLIGAQRVQSLTRNAGVASIAVCDPKLQAGARLSPKATAMDWSTAVGQRFGAAIIAVPHDLAVTFLLQVAKLAPQVLVEKPLGRNARETEALLNGLSGLGTAVYVGLNYRRLKNVRHARRLLNEGGLGKVLAVETVLSHGAQPGYEKSWKTDPVRCGGGVCLDPGVHVFDLFDWMFGGAELAGGLLKTLYWDVAVEDHAFLALNLANGGMANVCLSLSSWQSRFEMNIETEKAQLLLRGRGKFYGPQRLTVVTKWPWLSPGEPRESEYNYGLEDTSLAEETQEFITTARGEQTENTLATVADALRTMRIVDACYQLPSTPPALRGRRSAGA